MKLLNCSKNSSGEESVDARATHDSSFSASTPGERGSKSDLLAIGGGAGVSVTSDCDGEDAATPFAISILLFRIALSNHVNAGTTCSMNSGLGAIAERG